MRRRGVRPSPLLYLMVAMAGILLGVALQLTVGLWWWVPPVSLLAGAWLVFFTSIWWHRPGRRTTSLRTELLTAVDPERGRAARGREGRERIRAAGLPLFEVEDWPGSASLGGWGGSDAGISKVELAFADGPGSTPVVRVGTVVDDAAGDRSVRVQLLGELTGLLLHDDAAVTSTPESVRDAHDRIRGRLRDLAWTPSTIRIDDVDRAASRLLVEGRSASYAAVDGVWATVVATRDNEYRLRTVTEPGRYLDQP